MNPIIGTLTIAAATLISVLGLVACMAALRESRRLGFQPDTDSSGWKPNFPLRVARWSLVGYAGLLTVASVLLWIAFAQSDFRLAYVAAYTERALPMGYKLAAFWAGQEGSLLLWAGMIGWMGVIAAFNRRRNAVAEEAVTLAVLAVVCGFFAALMLFAANPFAVVQGFVPADGRGLNPMLQDPAMLAHPPTLFLGYAGYTIPFAALFGAMVVGRTDAAWLTDLRRWLLFSWLLLGLGIIIGAWWAYIELGWGGYWAWDPVENASLLPWLTGTALLHTLFVQQDRGLFKGWNASLIAVTFILCIFGTYLTRSGVVASVHTFGASMVGNFFLVFIGALTAASVALLAWRRFGFQPDVWARRLGFQPDVRARRLGFQPDTHSSGWKPNLPLRSERSLESLTGREGMILTASVILVVMMAVTLVGTILPVLTGFVMDEGISVGEPFYNSIVAPLGLALAAVMATAPILVYGRSAGRRLMQGLIRPAAVGAVVTAGAFVLGLRNPWALLVTLVCTVGLAVMGAVFVRTVRAEWRNRGGNVLAASWRVMDANHRRWGGFAVHAGVILMIVGIAGSSLFPTKETFQVGPGEEFRSGRYVLTFEGLQEERRANYTAVVAPVTVTYPNGTTRRMTPESRFFDKQENPRPQIAVRTNLREDLYLILAGWEGGGKITAIQVLVNPLTLWIWIGSTVLTLGAILCIMPRFARRKAQRRAAADNNGSNNIVTESPQGTTRSAQPRRSVLTDVEVDGTHLQPPRRRSLEPVSAAYEPADSTRVDPHTDPAPTGSCPVGSRN